MWRIWIIPMLLWQGVLGILEGMRPPKEAKRESRTIVRFGYDGVGRYIEGECEVLQ